MYTYILNVIHNPSYLAIIVDKITFKSENASTIAIIKENITRLANYRRISLQETVTPVDESIPSFLSLVRIFHSPILFNPFIFTFDELTD